MEVDFNTLNFQNNNQYSKSIYPCPSFKMKMSELKGIDQFVAKKYKINPQPIKTLKDFQEKCKSFVEDIAKKSEEGNFSGRQQETQIQRKAMIKDWYDYVVKENGAYTGAMALMILGGITAGLKPKEDTLPPVLNKGVLANTIEEISNTIPENPNDNAVSFDKQYRLNLQKSMMTEEQTLDESLNGWIVIPSKEHDPDNFEANVNKLKMLSHDNWCTKSFNARPYLSKGNFHVYMEQGKPKLGIRFVGDKIQEIQGEKNNSRIPVKYGDIVKEHIKNSYSTNNIFFMLFEKITKKHANDYKLSSNAKKELKKLENTKAMLEKIKTKFPNGINNAPTKEVLEALGIKCKKDSDGLLTISHYGDNNLCYSYSDLGIDENRLFKDIKDIKGNADFRNTEVTSLGNLQTIGGNAVFEHSQITNLGNLVFIGKVAWFKDSKITDLGKLQIIGGDTIFVNSKITDLGNLQMIGGDVYIKNSHFLEKDFENIKVRGRIHNNNL